MFSVGDKVVHSTHGAGIITTKKEMQLTKTPNSYFVVEMPGADSTLMVPTDQAGQRLRPVSTVTTLNRLLTDVLTRQPTKLPKEFKKRAKQINVKLTSGKIRRWIEVIRDLSHLREQRPLCKTDKRRLERAIQLSAGELALAQEIDREKARSRLASLVEHSQELQEQGVDSPNHN